MLLFAGLSSVVACVYFSTMRLALFGAWVHHREGLYVRGNYMGRSFCVAVNLSKSGSRMHEKPINGHCDLKARAVLLTYTRGKSAISVRRAVLQGASLNGNADLFHLY